MPDKTVTELIAPFAVAVVGTGDGRLKSGAATTPEGQPNLAVQVITPVIAILVRAANLFFVTLSGTLVVGAFFDGSLKRAVIQAAAIVALGALKDCATVFGGFERKYPLASGSI